MFLLKQLIGAGFAISEDTTTLVDYLIVAGGGPGGSGSDRTSGGGGGGGVIAKTSQSLTLGVTYNIVVGAGGTSNTNGSNSTFNGETAIGGGYGGYSPGGTYFNAGSG